MDARIPYSLGSVLLLIGAFAVGWVIHQVFVVGSIGILSPPAVFGTIGGLATIAGGRRLERKFDPSDYVAGGEADDEDEDSFDEDLSPVPSENLEGLERDEPES